ncbi:MAG: helix-turn-helix transcriptional regulator [Clostridia bacterium]|nr:helix-turn-helix transcriptional regulator [Clostridia bacterium]
MRIQFDIERERSRELYKQTVDDNIDGQCQFNFHSQIELYFVDEGEIDACINTHRQLLKKDQMAVALSYDSHLFRSMGRSRSSILIVPPDLCREFTAAVQNKQIQNPFICDEETVKKIKFFLEALKSDGSNEVRRRGYIYVILGIVLDHLFLENTQAAMDTGLSSRILFFLNQNFRGEISLDSLAAAFGYSKAYLSRYFKASFGIGINRYVNILRLRNAMLLMRDGKNTHIYCALESGFTSIRTFYRVFKSEFGCTPSDYFALHNGHKN